MPRGRPSTRGPSPPSPPGIWKLPGTRSIERQRLLSLPPRPAHPSNPWEGISPEPPRPPRQASLPRRHFPRPRPRAPHRLERHPNGDGRSPRSFELGDR
ncbi:hypothetical protein EVAR_91262_1 [Eumeta japonica]|uniref:Uncharacterized protein n=1 Tax=Eumeta variegata TaxID=151549 RepID=A0A4C1T4W3_EUMVA|nr:hypothetical protein EVAR_91262_1 [Eumeta japonica]